MSELETFEFAYGCKRPDPAIGGGAAASAWDEAWELWKVAYAKGAENMRERAAKECDPSNSYDPSDWTAYANTKAECADAIRALPITPTNTEGEQA